jgi:PTS system mannose-specific IIC component
MEILRLSLLGGLFGLDSTAVGQFMVSRPVVAGAITGWVLGNPVLGVAVGGILELYLLVSFPTGGARFPEGSTATVVAVAVGAPFDGAGVLPLAVAVGLVWGQLGGFTIGVLRHANSSLVPKHSDATHAGGRVTTAHLIAIGLDFLRAAMVTASGVVAGRLVFPSALGSWPLDRAASVALLLVGGGVSAGILLHDVGGFRRRRVWFATGIALGIVGTRLL